MLKAQECRKKGLQWQRDAEEAADPNTRDKLQRVAALWITLAKRIERDDELSRAPRRPADLLRSPVSSSDVVNAADILRERLYLTDSEDLPEAASDC